MQTTGDLAIKCVLAAASAQLEHSDSPELDAQLLLAKVLGKPRSWLYTWPEYELGPDEQQAFMALVQDRMRGVPLAYLLGTRDFWNLTLQVGPQVLIPRPETERLVELALDCELPDSARVADLGTGSGAIALALAGARPHWQLYATDYSAAALQLAQQNCDRLKAANVTLLQGSWCEPLPAPAFDMILSNPPYLAADDEHLQQGDLRFEPRAALVASHKGLHDIELIAAQAWQKLNQRGLLLLEHGWQQAEAVRAILAGAGYCEIQTHSDHGGRDRVTMGRKP